MSKSKSDTKAAKPTKPEALGKVKDAGVTKPAQTVKAKSKDLAKNVAEKEIKKSKKHKVKEPTPEPSSDSEEADSSDNDSDSGSESDTKAKKPVANGKANGVAKAAAHNSSDDSGSDDSDSSASSDDEDDDEAPSKVNGSSKIAADDDSDSDESDSSDDNVTPAANKKTAPTTDSADESDSDDSASDGEAETKQTKKTVTARDSEDDSDDSDDSDSADDESEEEIKVETKITKRKAEDDAAPVVKKNKNESTDTSGGKNLFVGNLSWNIDEAWLREVFEEYGELSGARLITDRATGRSKGFGYVEFINAEDAAKAHAAKNGVELDGRAMNVDFATGKPSASDGQRQERSEDRRKSYGDQLGEPTDTLFVGNLAFDAGQEQVSEAFSAYGTILGVRLPTDRETGAPKGFGYVNFSTVEEATAALEAMQGQYLGSRSVRLDYSQPRPANNDSPGRGRGRGGGGFGGRGGSGFGGRGAGFGGRGGSRGGRGGSFGNSRGGRGGARGGSTNRGGFGDFSGSKRSFDD